MIVWPCPAIVFLFSDFGLFGVVRRAHALFCNVQCCIDVFNGTDRIFAEFHLVAYGPNEAFTLPRMEIHLLIEALTNILESMVLQRPRLMYRACGTPDAGTEV